MVTVDIIINRIKAYVSQTNLTKVEIAQQAHLTEGAVRWIKKPEWNPTLSTVRKLESIIPPDFNPPTDNSSHAA